MNDLQNFDAKKKFIHLNVGIESKLQVLRHLLLRGGRGGGAATRECGQLDQKV